MESTSLTNRASATVIITVLDINDHIPTFDQQIYVANISELAQVNDSVIDLLAVDRDEVMRFHHCVFSQLLANLYLQDAHGRFEFTLVNITDDRELPFAVSSETVQNMGIAQVTLTEPLDFETQTSYQFEVCVYNATIYK